MFITENIQRNPGSKITHRLSYKITQLISSRCVKGKDVLVDKANVELPSEEVLKILSKAERK